MRASIFGALVAKPITFPDDLEFSLFPLRSRDESKIGPSYTFEDHQSWNWALRRHPGPSEAEAHIKAGEAVSVRIGWIVANFANKAEFPEGVEFRILEP